LITLPQAEKATILIIENNTQTQNIKLDALITQSHNTLTAKSISHGRNLFAWEKPDLIIMDIAFPNSCGINFAKELRNQGNAHNFVPIIFKSNLGTMDEIVLCLKAGGDDYLPKPYDPSVALAKIEALLRRAWPSTRTLTDLSIGPFSFSAMHRRCYINQKDVLLNPKEFALLHYLALNESKTISTAQLYEAAWGQSLVNSKRALITTISRLREKIKESGYEIEAVRGVGYRLFR